MPMLLIGDKAPSFKGFDQNGATISSTKLKGKKVVLFFYPKDSTPTCTIEVCNLRDNYSKLLETDLTLIGVSPDDTKSHLKFATANDLPFPLITDEGHAICEKYGVWVEKNMYGKLYMGVKRTTFLIDEEGKIMHIFDKVDAKNHSRQIINQLKKIV
jgi:thioredoxin-dependent peroxiredoxin